MDAELGLSSLLEIVPLLDAGMQTDISLPDLLNSLSERLFPGAEYARLYRIGGHTAFVQAATRAGGDVPIDETPLFSAAVNSLRPAESGGQWVAPIYTSSELFGLLEMGLPAEHSLSQMSERMQLAAQILTPTLERVFSYNRDVIVRADDALSLVQSQYSASGTIFGSENTAEILKAIHSFTGNLYSHAHLGIVPDGDEDHLLILAEAEGGVFQEVSRMVPLTDYPASDTLVALEALTVYDVDTEEFLMDEERQQLQADGVRSLLIVPLVVNHRLTGLLVFTHSEPAILSPARLRALRNLANQIAVVFENRTLLGRAEASLGEVRTLYELNQAMVAAQDPLDILRVVRERLAPTSSGVNHLRFVRDTSNHVTDIRILHTINSDGEQVVSTSVIDLVPEQVLATLDQFLGGRDRAVRFDENIDQAELTDPLALVVRSQGFKALIAITLYDQGLPSDLILVSYDQPQRFDAGLRRLFDAISEQISIVLQNQRLLRDTQINAHQLGRQVRLLESLNNLAELSNTVQNEDVLLDQAIRIMVNTLDVDHGGIVLLDPQGIMGTVTSEHPNHGTVGLELNMADNPAMGPLREGRPVIISDISTDGALNDSTRESLQNMSATSMMAIPLIVDDRLMASIGFDIYKGRRQLTKDMAESAVAMCAQVGTGLQKIRLLADTQRRAEQLQRIASFGQSVQTTLDMQSILNIMLTETGKTLDVDQMHITLYERSTRTLDAVAYAHDGIVAMVTMPLSFMLDSNPLLAQAWTSREFLYVSDLNQQPEVRGELDASLRTVLTAPMRVRGAVQGLVIVGSRKPHAYSETDIAVFQQMMNQLTVALENAEAYAQSQRAAKNEALVNEIAVHLQQQASMEQILRVAVEELGTALGARKARIHLSTPKTDNEMFGG